LNGVNPNGTWSLYFADTIAGGGNATLQGWSLDITSVPEPTNVALGMLAGTFFAGLITRRFKGAAIKQPLV